MKVAVYTRVSTEDQANRNTIENQVIFGEKYCASMSLEYLKYIKKKV
ncbi:hypothetical protein [Clostridium sp.]|jgi:site-specific DNA recombinase|nr:hypothetical protein [Clostridium sp.]MDF2505102.1 hypothetical protein [Clostridium sp.]